MTLIILNTETFKFTLHKFNFVELAQSYMDINQAFDDAFGLKSVCIGAL